MSFIVQADSRRRGEGSFQIRKPTRKDAVETAARLLGQGTAGVTITDEDGRIFEPAEFALFIQEGS